MIERIKYHLTFIVLLISTSTSLFGGIEVKNARIEGIALLSLSSNLSVTDDKLNPAAFAPVNYLIKGSKVLVEFGVNEEKRISHLNTFKSVITFQYTPYNSLLVAQPVQTQSLEIIYNPGELHVGGAPKDKSILQLYNYYKIDINSISIVSTNLETGAPMANPLDLYLEAEIQTERYYNFDVITSTPNTSLMGYNFIRASALSPAYEIEFFWDYLQGAENYELEYTFVDNYKEIGGYGALRATNELDYDFNHDATRIITTQQFYRIPLTYERGYILFRIRGITKKFADPTVRIEGPWSNSFLLEQGTVNDYMAAYPLQVATITPTDAFAQNINWSSEINFDDNGKKGAAISYMDGVMNSRQTIAKLETDSKVMVHSNLYDFAGRMAISTLPAPVSSQDFFYKQNTNMLNATQQYDKNIFDLPGAGCSLGGNPMSSQYSTGAANYFSGFNPNKEAQQGLIPDANGYPFVQIEYYPDQEGRVKRLSSPGNKHYLESGHETKFMYVTPTQDELARMFGSEVGLEDRYSKSIMIDPNGQVSISYSDEDGAVVATAMGGGSPNNLIPLDENTGVASPLSQDLMIRNDADPTNLSYTSTASFFAAQGELNQSIDYTLTSTNFTDPCAPSLCFDCFYELDLSITDDCGNEILDSDPATSGLQPFPTVIVGAPIIADGTCTSPTISFSLSPSPLPVTLPSAGVYHITKTLRVSTLPIDQYALLYIENNTCLQTLEDFQQQQLSTLDLSGCLGSTCVSCSTSVANYVSAHASELDAAAIAQLYHSCDAICSWNDPCDAKKQLMLQQFSPGGQYAHYQVDPITGVFYSLDPNSIFYSANTLGLSSTGTLVFPNHTWNNPPTPYTTTVLNTAGVMVSPGALTINEYISSFDISWANNLLLLHPEYCEMEFECSTDVLAANSFIQQLSEAQSFDDACIQHMLIPHAFMGGLNGAPTSTTCSCGTAASSYPSSFIFPTSLSNFTLPAVSGTPSVGPGSIYQFAMALARGTSVAAVSGLIMGQDDCLKDKEWLIFKALMNYYHTNTLAGKKAGFLALYSGPGICKPVPSGLSEVFPSTTSSAIDTYLASVTSGSDPGSGTPTTAVMDNCNTQCNAYVDGWLSSLSASCFGGVTPSNWTAISNALVQVCISGCDNTSPNGSSTTSSGSITVTGPSGPVSVSSFQDVLTAFGYPATASCSAYLINMPGPYGHSWSTSTQTVPVLDVCGCNTILENHYNYYAAYGTAGSCVISEQVFFENTYGFNIPNYAGLVCICDAAARVNPVNTGTPLNIPVLWNSAAIMALHDAVYTSPSPTTPGEYTNIIQVPPALACENCIDCDVVTNISSVIHGVFGSSTVISTIDPIALINFLNGYYNMNNTYDEWLGFITDCSAIPTDQIYSTGFSITMQEMPDMLNQFNQLSNGFTTSTGSGILYTALDVPAFFDAGIYPGSVLSASTACQQFTFSTAPSGLNTVLSMTNTACAGVVVSQFTLLPLSSGVVFSPAGNFHDLTWKCSSEIGSPTQIFIKYDYPSGGSTITADFRIMVSSNIQVLEEHDLPVVGRKCIPIMCSHDFTQPVPENDCITSAVNNAMNTAQTLYNIYLLAQIELFKANYKNHCFAAVNETFQRNYNFNEYDYTLYYFDQAGNLVHTVPPKGVKLLTPAQTILAINNIIDPVANPTEVYPLHSLNNNRTAPGSGLSDENKHYVIDNTYDSYDQPKTQTSPDGGKIRYLYDYVGRMAASQDSKQEQLWQYSYTLYDVFGRIIEFGKLQLNSSQVLTEAIVKDPVLWVNFLSLTNKQEVTNTYYDAPLGTTSSLFGTAGLENARNRVTAITYEDVKDSDPLTFEYGTYYSYDEHGNVKHLVQDNRALAGIGVFHQYKHIEYTYDLISGNLNTVSFQKGQADQFYHNYLYDADNRMHEVYTSSDGVIWDRDAKYFFYEHGPKAREEMGNKQVQGTDFAYTIQGWIKGINSNVLSDKNDIGKDAAAANSYMTAFSSTHRYFAKDAASFSLNYYTDDYSAINSSTGTANDFMANISALSSPMATGFKLDLDGPELFNGNITSMVTTITNIDISSSSYKAIMPQITAYKYDQLNRLKEMKAFSTTDFSTLASQAIDLSANSWSTPSAANFKNVYASTLSYDQNGNITSNKRLGHYDISAGATKEMDDMQYRYSTTSNTNKLEYVDDLANGGAITSYYGEDIEDQSTGNYDYDEIGQMIKDEKEGIAIIEWNNFRKVRNVQHSATSSKQNVYFDYNANGHRIRKTVIPQAGGVEDPSNRVVTHYLLDSDGKQMSIYEEKYTAGVMEISQVATCIYGIERVGVVDYNGTRILPPSPPPLTAIVYEHQLGQKSYELANHLGNIISTVNDWKSSVDDGVYNLVTGVQTSTTPDGFVDYYTSNILSATDYYPFGSPMPGRNFSPSAYRYGFNGQEKEDEIGTNGSINTAMFWEYDTRLGRRWDTDPIDKEWESPYSCFSNNPISLTDVEGLQGKLKGHGIKRTPKKKKKNDRFARNGNPRNKNVKRAKRDGPSIGTMFMKMCGWFRKTFTGAKHLTMTRPGGRWRSNPWQQIDGGTLAGGTNSNNVDIPNVGGSGPMDRLIGIQLRIWTNVGAPPMGYLRVTGIRSGLFGNKRPGYKTMQTNTGGGGFGFPMSTVDTDGDGVDDSFGYVAMSQWVPGIQRLYEAASSIVLRSFLPENVRALVVKYMPLGLLASIINSRVFTPYRYTASLRVENLYSAIPVNYSLWVRTRTWVQGLPTIMRGWLYQLLFTHK